MLAVHGMRIKYPWYNEVSYIETFINTQEPIFLDS